MEDRHAGLALAARKGPEGEVVRDGLGYVEAWAPLAVEGEEQPRMR